MDSPEDTHPLDEPLGELHEFAIKLAILGQYDLALKIANIYDKFCEYIVKDEETN